MSTVGAPTDNPRHHMTTAPGRRASIGMEDPRMVARVARSARPVRLAAGLGLTVSGLAMLVLPGPGLLTLLAAAHVLADDIPGVRGLLQRLPGPLGLPLGPVAQGQTQVAD